MWPRIQSVARARGLKLASPAASPCGGRDYIEPKYADPFKWMDDFMASCKGW